MRFSGSLQKTHVACAAAVAGLSGGQQRCFNDRVASDRRANAQGIGPSATCCTASTKVARCRHLAVGSHPRVRMPTNRPAGLGQLDGSGRSCSCSAYKGLLNTEIGQCAAASTACADRKACADRLTHSCCYAVSAESPCRVTGCRAHRVVWHQGHNTLQQHECYIVVLSKEIPSLQFEIDQ